jgi:hypothetical protein
MNGKKNKSDIKNRSNKNIQKCIISMDNGKKNNTGYTPDMGLTLADQLFRFDQYISNNRYKLNKKKAEIAIYIG